MLSFIVTFILSAIISIIHIQSINAKYPNSILFSSIDTILHNNEYTISNNINWHSKDNYVDNDFDEDDIELRNINARDNTVQKKKNIFHLNSKISLYDKIKFNTNAYDRKSVSNPIKGIEINQFITKTGTTIVGICCEDGVVLGADTRVTGGHLVISKEKQKIHGLSSKIYCCTAGTVADCDQIVKKVRYELSLHDIKYNNILTTNDNRDTSSNHNDNDLVDYASLAMIVKLMCKCYDEHHGRVPECVFIVGGMDHNGNNLYHIDSEGISYHTPYCSLGSGSTKAYSIIESELLQLGKTPDDYTRYVSGLSVTDAVEIVKKAVHSGIQNDLGSGSNIDLVMITSNEVKKWREVIDDKTVKVTKHNENSMCIPDSNSNDTNEDSIGRLLDIDDNHHTVEMIYEE